jgi:dTDP-glucose pyrophosphorylase
MLEQSQSWEDNLISDGATLIEAAAILNVVPHKTVLIVNSDQKLVGTLTDGDLRRSLLAGAKLEDEVKKWMNREFTAATSAASNLELVSQMQSKDIHEIPIVDELGKIKALVTNHQSDSTFGGTFVIMAGGRGIRLMPMTEFTPKPMLRVGGRPILENILTSALAQGFRQFTISINYLGDVIQEYFGDGSKWGATIKYVKEESPLGTAGSLSLLEEGTEGPIIVVNGDLVTDLDYRAMLQHHHKCSADVSMAIRSLEHKIPYGVVQTVGQFVSSIQEKPTTVTQVNSGVYILESTILSGLKRGQYIDMTELIQNLLDSDSKVAAFPIHEAWMDIGTPNDLRQANEA